MTDDNQTTRTATAAPVTPAAPKVPAAQALTGTGLPKQPAGGNQKGGGAMPVTQAKGSNSAAMKQAWFDKCTEFGTKEGLGKATKMAWWDDLAERAHRKEIDVEDVEKGYGFYHKARQAANPDKRASRGVATGVDEPNRISEAKRLVSVVQLPNIKGLGQYSLACRVVRDSKDVKGATDALVYKLMVRQFAQPETPMSKDDMEHYLSSTGKQRHKKTLADECETPRRQIERIAKKHGWKAHLRSAFNSLGELIENEGGTTREQERKARDLAARAKEQERRANKKKKK